jgi:uncharacterized membrane protein
MKLSVLWHGLTGHPIHPPLTDVTVGAYTIATAFALLSRLGVSEDNTTTVWWLVLVAGLVTTVPTALTGFADWLSIQRGTPLWRTATAHLSAMVTATILFAITAGAGHGDYVDGTISGGSLVLTLVGYAVLILGGWLNRLRSWDARAEPGGGAGHARSRAGRVPGEGGGRGG